MRGCGGFKRFYEAYYAQLVGKKIVKTGIFGGQGFPYLEFDDGTRVEISQDEEGNGPGFLFGLPRPEGF